MTDTDLIETMAEMLYDRSVAGYGRDQAPPWASMPYEIREYWRDISRAAVNHVRVSDEATAR